MFGDGEEDPGLSELELVRGLCGVLCIGFFVSDVDLTHLPLLPSVIPKGQRQAPSLNDLPPVHPEVVGQFPSELRATPPGQPVVTVPQFGPWQPGSTKKHWPLRPLCVPAGQDVVVVPPQRPA